MGKIARFKIRHARVETRDLNSLAFWGLVESIGRQRVGTNKSNLVVFGHGSPLLQIGCLMLVLFLESGAK